MTVDRGTRPHRQLFSSTVLRAAGGGKETGGRSEDEVRSHRRRPLDAAQRLPRLQTESVSIPSVLSRLQTELVYMGHPCQITQFSGNPSLPISDVSEFFSKNTSMCSNDINKILDADHYQFLSYRHSKMTRTTCSVFYL